MPLLSLLDRNRDSKKKTSSRHLAEKKEARERSLLGGDVSIGILVDINNHHQNETLPQQQQPPNHHQQQQMQMRIYKTNVFFNRKYEGQKCIVFLDKNTDSILWEYAWKSKDSIELYQKMYLVEIMNANVKKIYVSDFDNRRKRITIQLKYPPKITERIAKFDSRICYPTEETDDFLKSVKNWSFCRVLNLVTSDRVTDFSKFFRQDIVKVDNIREFDISPDELITDVDFSNSNIPFNVQFLMNCVNTKFPGLLNDKQRFFKIEKKLTNLCKTNSHNSVEIALRKIMEENSINYDSFDSMLSVNVKECKYVSLETNDDILVNRIVITPLCIEYYESLESGNRVLRKYKSRKHDFLRVSFSDNSSQKFSLPFFSEDFKMRFKDIIMSGIKICGKFFEMLAYSNSQLRSCSAWFVTGIHPQKIIDSLGNYQSIKEPGKYGSRIGLCFSSTKKGNPVKYLIGQDIQDSNEQYIFNDGVGLVAYTFAKNLATTSNIQRCGSLYIPSALQFRMNTFKGVVQVDLLNEELKKVDMVLSPNQCKVPGEIGKLTDMGYYIDQFELISYSDRKGISNLNKQIVLLLLSNKLPINNLKQIVDEETTESKLSLQHISSKMFNHKIARNIQMYSKNYPDNFCTELQKCGTKSTFKNLMDFRIPINSSCSLIGVLDFSFTLEEDEVFIQLSPLEGFSEFYPPESFPNGGIVEGDVVVTKNPCLHPGDIRKLKAINDHRTEKLKHLKDVIVFSAKGKRPQPSKMSGSDLDGDIYFATWDRRLFEFEEFEPMSSSSSISNLRDDCDYKSIRHFFHGYIENDILGRIAVKHMEIADAEEDGARSEKCLHFADLHSQQVDSVKTGLFVDPKLLPKTQSRPHYMRASPFSEQYHSKSPMGQLYTHMEFKVKYVTRTFEKSKVQTKSKSLASKPIDHPISSEIKNLFQDYKSKLKLLMNQYQLYSEAKIISGFIDYQKKACITGQNWYQLRESIYESIYKFVNEFEVKIHKLLADQQVNESNSNFKSALDQTISNLVERENGFGSSFYWLVIDKIVQ